LATKTGLRIVKIVDPLGPRRPELLVTRPLLPGCKYVGLLSQLPGIGTLASQSSGYLYITATEPVFAFELFGDAIGSFLSAVPIQY
jgi:hypothetical protein